MWGRWDGDRKEEDAEEMLVREDWPVLVLHECAEQQKGKMMESNLGVWGNRMLLSGRKGR